MSQQDKLRTYRTVREISRETGIHRSSLSQIICKDLHLKCFKRRRAQKLRDTRTALLAWSALTFCFRSSHSMPLTLFSLRTKRCSRSLRLKIGRTKSVADYGNFRKRSLVFSSVCARSAAAWPPVNCASVSQRFEELINTTFCPAFLRKFVCQPLCCVLLQIQTFYQNLALVA